MRSRLVRVDTGRITAARRGREVLRLNLFDDAVVDVDIQRVRPTRTGYFLSGRPRDLERGEVRLVVNGPVMVGTVVTPHDKYTIRSAGSNRHIIRQIDPAKEPFECAVEEAPPADPSFLPAIASTAPEIAGLPAPPTAKAAESLTEDGSEVRVLLLYTPAVQTNQGGVAGMRALVDLYMQSANQAFEDSGINPRLVLAHSAPVDYSGVHPLTDLRRLRDPQDGYMDEIHTLRSKHAADLVHLLTDAPTRIRGVAFQLGNESLSFEDHAFALTAVDSELVFTHEIGHNFGVAHDRYVNGGLRTIYPYAHGYVNEEAFEPDASADTQWHTVMAYDDRCSDAGLNCEWLLRFSNPDQHRFGDPLGIPADSPEAGLDGPADARLTVNNTARWVGSFRSEACPGGFVTPNNPVAPAGGGEIALRMHAGTGCVWEAFSDTDFLSITSAAYSAGEGIVKVRVEENRSGAERHGTLTIGNDTVTVRQLASDKGICSRTSDVVLAILEEIYGVDGNVGCDEVSDADLAQARELFIYQRGITSLSAGDFDGLSGLKTLNLETNRIRELPDGIFDDLTSLERLFIGDNELSELPEGILDNLTELQYLDLENMNLTTLPEGAFSNLANLKQLQLNVNDIANLPSGLFAGLSRLESLDIHGNEITELPQDLFDDLSSLEDLNLAFNRFEELPVGVFAGLSKLQKLRLDANRLTHLPDGLFGGLTSLRILLLDENRLAQLPAGLFAGLSNLNDLELRRNQLTGLSSGLFADLSNLELLALTFNRLAALPEDLFAGLANLKTLDLYDNALFDLAANQFSGLSALEYLYIGGNHFTRLPADLFSDLSRLGHLSMTDNRLTSLPDGIFAGLESLHTLHLGRNAVDPMPVSLTVRKVGQDQFKAVVPTGSPFRIVVPVSVGETGVIEGDMNNITVPTGAVESEPMVVARSSGSLEGVSVDLGSPPGLPSGHTGYELLADKSLPLLILPSIRPEDAMLSGMGLSDGDLSPVFSADTRRYEALVSHGVSKLTVSVTTSNANAAVEFLDADEGTLADADPLADGHQVSLAVGENTINVRVTSEDETITATYVLVVTRDGVVDGCVRNAHVKEAILAVLAGVDACGELTSEQLLSIRTLDLSSLGISSLSERDLAGLDSLEELNLSQNDLLSLPSGIFSSMNALKILNLEQNQLIELQIDFFSGLGRLTELELGNNRLSTLPVGIFSDLTALEILGLNGNRLIDLSAEAFSELGALEHLNLSFNSLTQLRSGVFSGLKDLNTLVLSANEISVLPVDLFEGLLNLRSLSINSAHLRNLPEGIFSGLSELRTLELGDNRIEQLPPDIFSGLKSLRTLRLDRNRINALRADVFSGLGSLQFLWLNSNRLSELPPGIFSGLTELAALHLDRNAVPLLSVPVSIEKAGVSGFKALVPTGAPFTIELPITISESGEIDGGAKSLRISTGKAESALLGVTRVAGTEAAVSVDIGELPALPSQHDGYSLEKDGTLPTTILPGPKDPPPAQVTNVQVAPGEEQLEVTWTAAADANGYKLQWKSSDRDYGEERQADLAGGETNTYTILGLTPGIEYTVRVIATRENADDGPPSDEVTGTPMAMPASQVQGVVVTAGIGQLEVSWTAVSNASGYKVQWKSGDEDYDELRQALLSGGDTVEYTITGLAAGTEYTVRVIATKAHADDSAPSEEATGVPRAMSPDQVMGVALVVGVEQLEVSWAVVTGADGYKVEWKSGAEDYDQSRQAAISGGDMTSYSITGLTAGTEYTVRVIAVMANADDGAPSSEATGVPKASAPAQVTGVAVEPAVGELEVSWTAVPDADGYKVQWKSGAEAYDDSRQAAIMDGAKTDHAVTGLTPGTEYTIRVLATREHADDGVPSEEATGVPMASPPAQVTGVAVTPGIEELEVSWDAVSGTDGYKVQWKSGDADYDESRQAAISGGDVTSHSITHLTPGAEYQVRVIATKANAHDGVPSDEVTGIPKAQPPAQVTGVAVAPGFEELQASWDAVFDANGYKVQWKSGSQDYDEERQVALLGSGTTSYTIMDLITGTEYTIRVIATKDHADDGEPSDEVTGTPASPDPDVNADGTLDGDDAQVMYQAYASEEKVGDGESGGTPESRRTLLAGLAGTADPTDDDLKAMLRKANVWRSVGLGHGGDINEDGAIDGDDAFVMYYAYEFADLVGDGQTGGTARHRQHLLASRSGKDDPSDADLKKMLRRANKLKEDFG